MRDYKNVDTTPVVPVWLQVAMVVLFVSFFLSLVFLPELVDLTRR